MKEVQVINPKLSKKTDDILRVAAYCRVSTDSRRIIHNASVKKFRLVKALIVSGSCLNYDIA